MFIPSNRRLLTASAIMLSACLLAPIACAATAVYDIQQADLIGTTNSCGNGSYYGNPSGGVGFGWTDTLPSGATITTVTIEWNTGVDCHSTSVQLQGELNGQATGSWAGTSYCNCGTRSRVESQSGPVAAYAIGASNEFHVTNQTTWFGFCPDTGGAFGAAYGRVTVDYTEGGGGPAVPAASTTSIVATIVLLLGASLIFLGRKSA